MDWFKDLKLILDLGMPTAILLGFAYLFFRPPQWIRMAVDSHHQLAEGVRSMGDAMQTLPRREELQELLIGQEALRRETMEVKEELRDIRRALDGSRAS